MKLSDNTLTILKNFSTINQGLVFKQGNQLRTISPLKTVYVEATVSEAFPQDFAIYDLNKLLAKLSLYKDADLTFSTDKVTLATNDSKRKDSMKFSSPTVITSPPEKGITLGDVAVEFDLSESDLEWMRKSAGISGSPNFIFESDGSKIYFLATDIKDDSADVSRDEIGAGNGTTFKVVMKVDNFKMIPGSYSVSIARKGLARFSHKTVDITYFVAIEASASTFEG
jgi:gp45 sliding clamp, C terminal